ncbi:hypothetical protein ACP70R_023700 [Stipagrostis hirtigluma subsp. patula]
MGESKKEKPAPAVKEGGEEKKKQNVKKGGAAGGGEEGEGNEQPQGAKKNKDGGDEEKKKAPSAVVLRVELHCYGCALKVKKAIKSAQGVESVTADMAAGTVTVGGKADPWELKECIEARVHKPVAFVSPANPPKKKTKVDDDGKKPAAADAGKEKGKSKANADDKKNKEAPESTVVLKIRMHCNGCIDRIKRKAQKIKGVKEVTVDSRTEQVTVKGTMDAKALPDVLRGKLKREVAVVAPSSAKKKESGAGGEKKQADGKKNTSAADADAEKGDDGGGAKKKKNKNKQQQEEGDGAGDDNEKQQQQKTGMAAAADQCEPTIFPAYGGGGYTTAYQYRAEMLHAPQLFSDENPNACSLM